MRTLLAFIDNIYDSASRRMVEQRIQSQKSAVEALHRIVEVAKNADLGAPGEELNPNLTAAYLDHLLSDEENSRFEEIVFQSDIFLAEAVACHKILTVILSRPVTVSGDLRQKLYRIAPSGIAFPVKPEKSPCFPPSALPKASSETMPRTAAARHPATSLSEEHSEEYSETTSAVSSKTPYFTESLSTVSSPKREKFDRFSES
ncbi:MAG: hypothetical protein LBQ54_02160 [Planctomycetaceae bacterium]|nr:hypothetical protein [Planctomycetaceae bacterium]